MLWWKGGAISVTTMGCRGDHSIEKGVWKKCGNKHPLRTILFFLVLNWPHPITKLIVERSIYNDEFISDQFLVLSFKGYEIVDMKSPLPFSICGSNATFCLSLLSLITSIHSFGNILDVDEHILCAKIKRRQSRWLWQTLEGAKYRHKSTRFDKNRYTLEFFYGTFNFKWW